MASPLAMRLAISLAWSPDERLRSRSMKTVRCSFDNMPINGQPAMSALAMNVTSAIDPSTMMSVHETWFDATSNGR
jgi:hypothetical protein